MFDWVHTIERIKVAKKLNQHRPSNLDKLNVCIQINLDEEESKSGIKIGEAEGFISSMMEFDNLRVRGLMTIPKLNWLKKQTGESLYYSVPQLSLLQMRCTDAPRRKDLQT